MYALRSSFCPHIRTDIKRLRFVRTQNEHQFHSDQSDHLMHIKELTRENIMWKPESSIESENSKQCRRQWAIVLLTPRCYAGRKDKTSDSTIFTPLALTGSPQTYSKSHATVRALIELKTLRVVNKVPCQWGLKLLNYSPTQLLSRTSKGL